MQKMNQSRKRNEILQVFDGYFANKVVNFTNIRSDLQEQIRQPSREATVV
jgi:hypothetical protein